MKKLSILLLSILSISAFISCDDDDNIATTSDFTLNISGLEDLGADYVYEGWLIVNGSPVSAGRFSVNSNGDLSQTTFSGLGSDILNATNYVLTIEPAVNDEPTPSDVHILAGDFSGSNATLSVNHAAALGSDFTSSTGTYIFATPTNGANTDELSGVWWIDPTNGPSAGLSLPTLPEGWMYEGWAVIDGTPVTTGKFTATSGSDDFNGFSGSESAPPFPGEDFLQNAPNGLNFPVSLAGAPIVISVEPHPDNSPNPFTLKPLVGVSPQDAADHTPYAMGNNAAATNPTGVVTR